MKFKLLWLHFIPYILQSSYQYKKQQYKHVFYVDQQLVKNTDSYHVCATMCPNRVSTTNNQTLQSKHPRKHNAPIQLQSSDKNTFKIPPTDTFWVVIMTHVPKGLLISKVML